MRNVPPPASGFAFTASISANVRPCSDRMGRVSMSGRANEPASGVDENGVWRATSAPRPIAGVLVSTAGPEGHACAAPNLAPWPVRFVPGACGSPGESPQRWSAISSLRAHEDTGERKLGGSAISTGEVSSCLRARARLRIAPGTGIFPGRATARSTPREWRRCSRARAPSAECQLRGLWAPFVFSAVFSSATFPPKTSAATKRSSKRYERCTSFHAR